MRVEDFIKDLLASGWRLVLHQERPEGPISVKVCRSDVALVYESATLEGALSKAWAGEPPARRDPP